VQTVGKKTDDPSVALPFFRKNLENTIIICQAMIEDIDGRK
jgi:hypothetical protein